MAEFLLSEFQGECAQKEIIEEVDHIDLKNEVENYGEKVHGDDGKRKRAECQSQLGSKKLKIDEEDPENTTIDDLPNELLQPTADPGEPRNQRCGDRWTDVSQVALCR